MNETEVRSNEKPRILVVDDEPAIRDSLRMFLEQKDFACFTAENGEAALSLLSQDNFINLLITDLKMPKVGGLDLLKEVKRHNPFVEVIVLTGYPTVETAVQALKIGAYDYITKPFNLFELLSIVERCLERQRKNINKVAISELASMFEVSRSIANSIDKGELLNKVLQAALEITGATCGSLLLLDEQSQTLSIKAARGLPEEVIKNTRIPLGEGISGKVALERRSICGNIKNFLYLRSHSENGYESKKDSEPTFVSIAIASQDKLFGVLNVSDKADGERFTAREQTLLGILADEAAIALENASLYEQLQRKIYDLNVTIDKLNQAQAQLIQSEKLAALGRFSAGIAHEVKNPLAIVLGGVEYLEARLSAAEENIVIALQKMKEATLRANAIILNLLRFARPSNSVLEYVTCHDLVTEALALFQYRVPNRNIRIETEFADDNATVYVDRNQIQQVLFNLFSNATDAMPNGGSLLIRTFFDPRHSALGDKPACVMEVTDTGEGISPENLSKLFEPFFTTKRDRRGTGLGLSMAKMIIENHNGKILIESELGKGTRVSVVLPLKERKENEKNSNDY
ncbi:MAG: response regulator [Candidatus Omnitrophica bacterium]|nr:response regulator [Candidatus Omnitrophota bacterium]